MVPSQQTAWELPVVSKEIADDCAAVTNDFSHWKKGAIYIAEEYPCQSEYYQLTPQILLKH